MLESAEQISFSTDIRPLLNRRCVSCHGGVKQAADLTFLMKDSTLAIIEPGEPDDSYLLERVTADDEQRMPPADHAPRLKDEEVALLRQWIQLGAHWEEHWAYIRPTRPPTPQVSDPEWVQQPLDAHVLSQLEANGLQPAPAADRIEWLRRATFDLTGLPPSPEAITAFVEDSSSTAYQTVVDRLLESTRYGERWASLWLDLARYADTQGYEKDNGRTVWPFRDWLIRALNDDLSFDAFTIRLLAGDLLPNATTADLIATTFHRNTQTNTEGGTDDEEYRLVAVTDRVNTTWQVWQATTFGCTQCHAHPYAPFEHADYYRSVAFFNTSLDHDRDDESPVLSLPLDPAENERAFMLDRTIGELRRSVHAQVWSQFEVGTWQNLSPVSLAATGEATLSVAVSEHENQQVAEIVAGGTIAQGTEYTIEFAVGERAEEMTALRIDALPVNLELARRTPEHGFAVSRLQGAIVTGADEEPQPISFALVFCDEAEPLLVPQESLKKGSQGWGDYPRIWRARSAVFIPTGSVRLSAGSRLQLRISQQMAATGQLPMVLRRARFWLSADAGWTELAGDPQLVAAQQQIEQMLKERKEIKSLALPVMAELPQRLSRESYVFERGNWQEKGPRVTADVPRVLPPLPDDVVADRLALARWLVSADNPLTARVMVNRLWEQLFGTGIVETVEDFGPVGAPPSNQGLLDDLAVRFQTDYGWSIKEVLREIVLSATYRQAARTTGEMHERDPRNELLAHGPRNRLSAEMVRDQALAVSGLLSAKMYGPPVMPPQPDGVWRSVYNGSEWTTSEGEDRYRRAVYTYWKRTSGYPSFITFDTPTREVCSLRRLATNTPLQALVLMNDPVFVECAVALGRQMTADAAAPREVVRRGYRLVTGRDPDEGTVADLVALHERAAGEFAVDPEAARSLAPDAATYAASAVANAILNLDVVLTK